MKLYELQLDDRNYKSPFTLKVLSIVDKLAAKKNSPLDMSDKEALRQSILNAVKKHGESIDAVIEAATKVIEKRMRTAGRYSDLVRAKDAVKQAFKHALSENADSEHDLFYKGYAVDFHEDSDGFFWLNYQPELPKDVDSRYNKASNRTNAEIVAKRAIDELKKNVNEEQKWDS